MKKSFLYFSLLLNILLFSYIFRDNIRGSVIKNRINSPYYKQRTSLFNYLKIDSNDIVFVGNSITQRAEWAELLNSNKVKNRGIGSDDTDGLLNRIDSIAKYKPSKIFIMIGINDLYKGKPSEEIIENYKKIINRIKMLSNRTTIYVQSVLPVNKTIYKSDFTNDDIKQLNTELSKISGITYIDLFSHFIDNGQLAINYTDDGIHLLGEGYALWAKLIRDYITQ